MIYSILMLLFFFFPKISRLGFKSVAHYLIQTRLSETNLEENQVTKDPVSAKRSLPFEDIDEPSHRNESLNTDEITKPLSEDTEEFSQPKETLISHENLKLLSVDTKDENDQLKEDKADPKNVDSKPEIISVSPEEESKLKKVPSPATEVNLNSIAGRLRYRRMRS